MAHAHTLVRVDESALFVCPECARPLRAAEQRAARVSHTPRLAAGAVVLLAAAGAAYMLRAPAPKPVRLSPMWVRMEAPPPAPPPPFQVRVTPLASRRMEAVTAAPHAAVLAPVVAVTFEAPPPPPPVASVLMRMRGDPALAADMVPQLAQAFLRSTGDQDIEILRAGAVTQVRGQSAAGLEAVSIIAAPVDVAFASLANGGAELVFSPRQPTPDELRVLGRFQDAELAKVPDGMAALFAPVPSDPVASAFLNYAGSAAGRAALAAAGFAAPPPPPPAPKHTPARPANKVPGAPAHAPAVASARPASAPQRAAEAPKQAVTTPAPPAPAPPPAAEAPPAIADATSVLGTTPKEPRTVILPAGSKISFGPLKDVEMPAANPRMVFLQPGKTPRAPGQMQVDCMIQTSGVPTDCRRLSEHGAADVSGVILAWLGSGAIRYSPATKNGHPVKERRVLTVNFREPVAHED